MKKTIWIVITLTFIVWAFIEQANEVPRVWVQVIGVLLFFYAMMRLSQKINQGETNSSEVIDENKTFESSNKVKSDERI